MKFNGLRRSRRNVVAGVCRHESVGRIGGEKTSRIALGRESLAGLMIAGRACGRLGETRLHRTDIRIDGGQTVKPVSAHVLRSAIGDVVHVNALGLIRHGGPCISSFAVST